MANVGNLCIGAVVAMLMAMTQAYAQSTKIAFGTTSRTIFVLPVWLAIERGFFRAEGLEIEVKVVDGLDLEKRMLREGALQIAIGAPDAVMADAIVGGSTIMIARNAQRLPHFIIANSRFRSLAQLKGARVGVAGASDGTTSLMGEIAKAGGLNLSDLTLHVVGGAPTRWRFLQEGKIDVALQPFPQSYEAEAAGYSNLGALLEIIPHYQFSAFVLESGWGAENRTSVVSFLRALRNGAELMYTDPDASAIVAAREMRTSMDMARRAVGDTIRLGVLARDLAVSERALRRVFQTLQDSGRISKSESFVWERYVDERYLSESRSK